MTRALALAAALLLATPALAEDPLAGSWTGSYVCAQGETGLALDLRRRADGGLRGVFRFHPLKSNPVARRGCFEVSASPAAARPEALELRVGRWLLRPDGYVTVDLLGRLGAEDALHGSVAGPGCTGFSLRRAEHTVPPPARACAGDLLVSQR